MWVALFLVLGAVAGYFIHSHLITFLQRPLNESLYYTTPGGAFSFIIKVCTVFGLVIALPMLIYQIFAFFGPLISMRTRRQVVSYVGGSFLLATGGIAFAYLVSLPAALHFLVSFGGDSNIHSLITADEYFNFVLTYIAGFAILFQVPLIILLIDRIKPIPPKKLFSSTRYVILVSFIVAAVITPTPDPMNQLLMAGPIILLFFASASLVSLRHVLRQRRSGKKKAAPVAVPALFVAEQPQQAPIAVAPTLAKSSSSHAHQPAPPSSPRSRVYADIVMPRRPQIAPRSTQRSLERPQVSVEPRPAVSAAPTRLISDFMTPQRAQA